MGGNINHHSNSNGLAIDGTGNIWVSNTGTKSLTELNNLGAPQSPNMVNIVSGTFNAGGFTNAALANPVPLAIDTNNNVFAGNELNANIVEFSNAGNYIRTINGSSGGLSSGLSSLAIDAGNNVWAVDGNVVGEFSNTGSSLSGSNGYVDSGDGDLDGPLVVTVDGADHIWIADANNGYVTKLSDAGAELVTTGYSALSDPITSAAIDGTNQYWILKVFPILELCGLPALTFWPPHTRPTSSRDPLRSRSTAQDISGWSTSLRTTLRS